MAHRATIPVDEVKQMTADFVSREHKAFLAKTDNKGVSVIDSQVCSMIKPEAIIAAARDNGSDLIVIGTRGKDTIAALLLAVFRRGFSAHRIFLLSLPKKKGRA